MARSGYLVNSVQHTATGTIWFKVQYEAFSCRIYLLIPFGSHSIRRLPS